MSDSGSDDLWDPAGAEALGPASDADLLTRILEAIPGGVVHVDPDGHVRLANARGRELLGLSWDDEGRSFVADYEGAVLREDGSVCPVEEYPVTRCLATKQPQGPTTLGVRRPHGDIAWAIFTALPAPAEGGGQGAVVTFVDITHRRREELRAAAERQLLDTARMIHFDDHPDTTVAVFHEPLERLLELTGSRFGFIARIALDDPVPAELPVLVSADRDFPADFRRSQPPIPIDPLSTRCLRERAPLRVEAPGRVGGPFRQRVPDRVLLYPLIAGERTLGLIGLADCPEPYDEALLEYLAPLLRACSDLLGALDERRTRTRLEAQLARAERLASVGTLAAGMAHEINNPLAYVHLNLEACLHQTKRVARAAEAFEQASDRAEATDALREANHEHALADVAKSLRRHAHDAIDGAERVQRIVKDLMTFSRVSEPRQSLVDLNSTIHIALKMADHEIKYRARLECELGQISPIHGHDGRLSQVFLNLLLNAARAIEEGQPDDNEIRVRSWEADGRVHVEVSDTGSGIEPAHLHRLFEPFFSTRAAGSGAGLGLSICHNVISAHNGSIDVESELGRGSRFRVSLPVAEVSADLHGRVSSLPPDATRDDGRRRRILLIDDEAMVLRILGQLLTRRFDVVTAEGLESAVGVLSQADPVDLVLCDMMMLDGTGMDVHAWIAEHRPALESRLVFMTGGTFTPKARDFLHQEGRLHLKKPFSLKQLDEVLGVVVPT